MMLPQQCNAWDISPPDMSTISFGENFDCCAPGMPRCSVRKGDASAPALVVSRLTLPEGVLPAQEMSRRSREDSSILSLVPPRSLPVLDPTGENPARSKTSNR